MYHRYTSHGHKCKGCRIRDHKAKKGNGWSAESHLCCDCREVIPEYIPRQQYRTYMQRYAKRKM